MTDEMTCIRFILLSCQENGEREQKLVRDPKVAYHPTTDDATENSLEQSIVRRLRKWNVTGGNKNREKIMSRNSRMTYH